MKLYQLPNKSYFTIKGLKDGVLYLDHLDGAYSYCLDANKNVVHVSGNANIEPYVVGESD